MEMFSFHASFGKEFCCVQNHFCMFVWLLWLYKGYYHFSKDLHHFFKEKIYKLKGNG